MEVEQVSFDDLCADRRERVGSTVDLVHEGAYPRARVEQESAGIVARATYREPGKRSRDEYRLTPAGEDLLPVFLALVQWGDTYLQDGTPPLSFVDADTGKPVRVRVTADSDCDATRSADIHVRRSARTYL